MRMFKKVLAGFVAAAMVATIPADIIQYYGYMWKQQ